MWRYPKPKRSSRACYREGNPQIGKKEEVGTLVEEEAFKVRLSDLANENTGSPVKLEFQKNHK